MRHRRRVKHFGRGSRQRAALLRGLVTALIENERITTTVEKAKELRRHVEKAVTLGKDNTLARRRLLLARYPNKDIVEKIMSNLSKRFNKRPGGYTRIIKIGRRPGDTAEMAFIEFVDYDYTKPVGGAPQVEKPTKTKKAKDGESTESKATTESKSASTKKSNARLLAAKKKAVAKIQKRSRAAARLD